MRKGQKLFIVLVCIAIFQVAGCGGLKVNIGTETRTDPLKEVTLEGTEKGKVLVIPIRGFISDMPRKGLFREHAGMVEEVVSQLRKAEKDDEIKAVLLEINSPGGSTTASDILYHEIVAFKERSKAKIVAALMDVAASGGYYIALPADRIVAHPTTVTGSVGVIFIVPKVSGLMDKLGLAVEVNKSGKEKDIGSPFRQSSPEEQRILQELTDILGKRFLDLVAKHRSVGPTDLASISSARIYLAHEAMGMKLIDNIGYLNDALSEAKTLSGLSKDAKVVVYRRSEYPNDNIYNTSGAWYNNAAMSLIDIHVPEILPDIRTGFYYLWAPGALSQ